MAVRFSPHRQGAAHSLEATDIVLLRGTPLYSPDGEFDTRIHVNSNGIATRALWYRAGSANNSKTEFHLWQSELAVSDCEKLRSILNAVVPHFEHQQLQIDGNDCGDILVFWHNGKRFTAQIHTAPPELRRHYSQQQRDAFDAAANILYSLVSQRPAPIDPRRIAPNDSNHYGG